MKSVLAACVLLLAAGAFAKQLPVPQANVPESPSKLVLDPNRLPENTVAVEGGSVTLTCAVETGSAPGTYSIQWYEYAYTTNGGLISDNDLILGHPEAARYFIVQNDAYEYSLMISDLKLSDGGNYMCMDAQANPAFKRQHTISLTIMAAEPNCTTTINPNGIVLDKAYHTNDCTFTYQGGLIPNMTWSGPGPFGSAYVAAPNSIWAGMQFNVTRDMDTRAHQCTTFFTGYFLPVDGNTASNVPTYTHVFQQRQMFVYWGPTSMDVQPIKVQYDAGDVLTCTADAFPEATYLWQNLRTNEISQGATLTLPTAWRGFNQTMRCEARNTIEGTIYSNNFFVAVDVAPLTTPSTTTPTTTTTAAPAVSPCTDLSGAWISTNPTAASLCIRLDLSNSGALSGLLKNSTDTYWVDIVGRAQATKFDQVGFNGIWPADLGVSSFIGECHRCFGQEQLLVNVVSKKKGSPCGTTGETLYTTQYNFFRSQTLQCPNIPVF